MKECMKKYKKKKKNSTVYGTSFVLSYTLISSDG